MSFWIIESTTRKICPSVDKPGDVDILGGRLRWSDPSLYQSYLEKAKCERPAWHRSFHEMAAQRGLLEDGGLEWPPNVEYLVGIEVKCAYVTRNRKLASHKASQRQVQSIREQVDGLLHMGLNRVLLLDIIANPPSEGSDGSAWTEAAIGASASYRSMRPILESRLYQGCPAGHVALPSGAVPGGDETMRGAISPVLLRHAVDSPLLQTEPKVRARRQDLNERLLRRLKHISVPRYAPAVFVEHPKGGGLRSLTEIHSPPGTEA